MRDSVTVCAVLLAFAMIVGIHFAFGHDASDPDAAWFNSLQQPVTHMNCCGPDKDCRAYDDADVDLQNGVYWVRYQGEWLKVPPEKVLDRYDNPTGHFVACVHALWTGPLVLCAVRGMGA